MNFMRFLALVLIATLLPLSTACQPTQCEKQCEKEFELCTSEYPGNSVAGGLIIYHRCKRERRACYEACDERERKARQKSQPSWWPF